MYARLTPTSGATIGNLLQELARVCAGNITSTSGLSAFNPAGSEIVNTVATNWTLSFPTSYTANTNVYVLQSQCVNTSKIKYARLMVKGTGTNQPFVEPTGGTANVFTLTTSSTIYLEMNGATGVNTSTGAVTNPTYYHQSNEGHILDAAGTIYVSASARHLLIYSSTAAVDLFFVAEHPETALTTSKSLIPIITYRGRGGALTITTTSRETAAAASNSVAQIPTGFLVSNNTTSLQSIDSINSFNTFDFTQTYTGSRLPPDRAQTGTTARQMIARDLVYYDSSRNHHFINASQLTNIRYLPDTASTTTLDITRYTSGGTEYVPLPLLTSVLLVPKA